MLRAATVCAVLLLGCSSSIGEPADLDASAASCSDGVINGDETDVDCGGACDPCGIGLGCDLPSDCTTSTCAVGICLGASSCRLIAEAARDNPLTSGVYELTVDDTSFDAYCDFDTDGGGWTLVMKLTSGTATLAFASTLWTTEEVLAADDLAPHADPLAATEAKLTAFNLVSGGELRLELTDPAHSFSFAAVGNRTALGLFTGDVEAAIVENSAGNNCASSFLTGVAGYDATLMRHGQGHQFFGVNGQDSGGGNNGSLRFGFASNDENNNAWIAHQGVGSLTDSLLWDAHNDCDACGGCYGTAYEPAATTANLWIR